MAVWNFPLFTNAKCKENLAFSIPKVLNIWDCKIQVLQFFLQYIYRELHCSSIVTYIYIYSTFPPNFLSPLSHYLCSLLSLPSLFLHLLSPLFRPKHHPPPNININITHHPPSLKLHQASHPFHRWSFTRPLSHLSSHYSLTDSPSPISKSLCRFTHLINPAL